MLNTTKRITTPTRFALLALGAISLSCLALPAMAGDDATDAGAKNPSTCRDVVNHKCLTKPKDDHSSQNQDTRNQDKAAEARIDAAHSVGEKGAGIHSTVGIATYDKNGQITSVYYPKEGITERSYNDEAIIRVYRNGQKEVVYVSGMHDKPGSAGNGGAAGHTGARSASTQTKATVAAARSTAIPTPTISTTYDKATNTTTRDHRTGATAAPGGPPPAAAIGTSTKATPEQLAAQSGTVRDHRH